MKEQAKKMNVASLRSQGADDAKNKSAEIKLAKVRNKMKKISPNCCIVSRFFTHKIED